MHQIRSYNLCFFIFIFMFITACTSPPPHLAESYQGSDAFFSQLEHNISIAPQLEKIAEIDHSRLGHKAGSSMPPAKVIIFSNPELDTVLIKQNPLTAIDLPMRILAYKTKNDNASKIIFNSFHYMKSRYNLTEKSKIEELYNQAIIQATKGISKDRINHFSNNDMSPDGIITINSPYDFKTSMNKIMVAIESQDDTVGFGQVDFQARAKVLGENIAPSTLILFGGPAPGAKAMSNAPTLGLDAFCQKFLLWQDDDNNVHLSFNDLLSLAERQEVNKSLALRVINYRLSSVFEEALK